MEHTNLSWLCIAEYAIIVQGFNVKEESRSANKRHLAPLMVAIFLLLHVLFHFNSFFGAVCIQDET